MTTKEQLTEAWLWTVAIAMTVVMVCSAMALDIWDRGLYYEAYQRVIYPLKKGKTKWHT